MRGVVHFPMPAEKLLLIMNSAHLINGIRLGGRLFHEGGQVVILKRESFSGMLMASSIYERLNRPPFKSYLIVTPWGLTNLMNVI